MRPLLMKTLHLRFWFVAVLLGLTAASRPAVAAEGYTMAEDLFPQLRQVLADVDAQSPRMILRNLELMAADGDLQQAKSNLYPNLGGNYRPTWGREKRQDRPDWYNTDKVYYAVSLNQPVFHWGERMNSAKIGAIRRAIATDNHAEARRLLAHEVRTGFMFMVQRKVQMEAAQFARVMADNAQKVAEERLAKGEIAEGAVFLPRIAAEQAALAQETAEWNYEMAKQGYAALLGGNEPPDSQVPSVIPPVPSSAAAVRRELSRFMAQDEPDVARIRSSRREVEVNRLTYKNQRTRLLPKLSFQAAITQDEQSYSLDIAQKYGLQHNYVGLVVNWNIFDGFQSQGATRTALARLRQSEENFRQLKTNLPRDAQRAAKAVELAERQLVINERLLSNATGFLDYRQDEFRRGQASETDVNAARAAYDRALTAAQLSRYDYLLKLGEFVNFVNADVSLPSSGGL